MTEGSTTTDTLTGKKPELKTLKDFLSPVANDMSNYILGDLRQETIKHIKDLNNQKLKLLSQPLRDPEDEIVTKMHYDQIVGKIEWIKHFFNITEEEVEYDG